MASPLFRFKAFHLEQEGAAHPVGTDSVLLGAWAPLEGGGTVLDIGTGTGILALMVAQRTGGCSPPVQIDAVEIDAGSAQCAKHNFTQSPWSGRLRLFQGRLQDFTAAPEGGYGLLISNPPYFSGTIVAPDRLRRAARSTVSLRPDELVRHSLRLLSTQGRLAVILPPDAAQRLQEIGAVNGLYCNEVTVVSTRPDKPAERHLLCFGRAPGPFRKTTLLLFDEAGNPTPEYRRLTAAFYLDG
jgi:tRNA1Val (adenine37-N6)-methyltransferase